MKRWSWEKTAASTGIVFVILLVAAALIAGEPPKLSDPAQDFVRYFSDKQGAVLLSGLLSGGLGGVFFLWWLGSLRIFLRRHESDGGRLSAVAFGSGLVALATLIQAIALRSALAFSIASSADASVVHAIYNLSYALDAFNPFAVGTLLGAASISAARSGAFPKWLVWAGGLIGLLRILTGFDVILKESVFGDEGAIGMLAFVLVLAWVLAASVVMIRAITFSELDRTSS